MKISGFTFARNADKFYYPIAEVIKSALPLVDEFVAVICPGDEDDHTRDLVAAIDSPKVRIIDRPWPSQEEAPLAMAHSFLTNTALDACSGDWCLYLQADEVLHEDDLPIIGKRCRDLLAVRRVEGLLFDYLHFYGDYNHYQWSHAWYRREVRMIRNGIGLRSKGSAQSFRFTDGGKAVVVPAGARVFHYGYVRPPDRMRKKTHALNRIHKGNFVAATDPEEFDYGPLSRMPVFKGTHPAVMRERIRQMNWAHKLREADPPGLVRPLFKEERLKYRVVSLIEDLTGLDFNHKNYKRTRI
ncbi:MAG: hypothetical protein V2A77_05750 [Pseudomonadota bacterium]